MVKEEDDTNSACFFCFFFIIAAIATGAAITLTILLYAWGYVGFIGTSPYTFSSCATSYHTTKYSDPDLINRVVFLGISIATLAGILMVFISLAWMVKRCKSSGSISLCSKNLAYILGSLMLMGSMIPTGFYLTFVVQRSECTLNIGDQSQLTSIIVVSLITIVSILFVWLLTFCLKVNDRQQIYKYLQSNLTQPRDEKNDIKLPQNQNYFSKPRERKLIEPQARQSPATRKQMTPDREETKENIFESPNRNREDLRPRFVSRNKDQNPVLNLHPTLNIDKDYEYNRIKQDNKASYKNYVRKDEQALRKEEQRYYRNYENNRPLRPDSRYRQRERSRGKQGRSPRDDRVDDYDRDRHRPRRNRRDYIDNRDNYQREEPDYRRHDYVRDREPPRRLRDSPQKVREEAILRALTKPY